MEEQRKEDKRRIAHEKANEVARLKEKHEETVKALEKNWKEKFE